jgi:integrase
MKAKRFGATYRNLFAWRGSIWYSRVVAGRPYRVNTKCPDTDSGWKDARLFRDEYEHQKGVGRPSAGGGAPTFGELAARYFEGRKFSQLKPTTQADRRSHLAADGPLMPALGRKRIDEITADTLVTWWERESKARKWSLETGFRYLATIAEVLKQGRAFMHGRALATKEARERMAEERRTAAGRATRGDKRPIRDPEVIARLLEGAREEGLGVSALVLVLLDSGVRKGEALALRWGCVAWGNDEDDPRRHLLVKASRSRGAAEDSLTKSGRKRRVALSRRLRAALGELYLSKAPRPGAGERVFGLDVGGTDDAWARVTRRAGQPGLRVKDCRDTFGSWLLTLGVPIQYVSRQLGHGSISVTETHYAEYLGQGGADHVYVAPLPSRPARWSRTCSRVSAIAHSLLTAATRSPCPRFCIAAKML